MDAGTVLSWKFIAWLYLYYVMAVVLQGSVNCDDVPFIIVEEVVSIYDDSFGTPVSREPYFIKVNRCITGDVPDPEKNCWAKVATQEEIEIVVPDINNKKKFYKYIVYNHTSCKGEACKPKPSTKQHKTPSGGVEVDETEFKEKLSKNPDNLRNCKDDFCSKPQPRYMTTIENAADPSLRYLQYHQCLPGCNSTTETKQKNIYLMSGGKKQKPLITDRNCSQYKNKKPATSAQVQSRQSDITEPESKSISHNELFIYIGSSKVFLAALVLSLILLSILIVDFNLCHRKKGLLYTLLSCKKSSTDNNCSDCAKRQKEVIDHEIV